MKNEKGVTMIAVTIYIIALSIVIGIVANISNFFYKNVTNVKEEGKSAAIYNTFDMYFKKEFEKKENKIKKIDQTEAKSYIIFMNGNQYLFQDGGIYMNSVKICDNIVKAEFETYSHFDKNIVKVHLIIGDYAEFDRTIEYIYKD